MAKLLSQEQFKIISKFRLDNRAGKEGFMTDVYGNIIATKFHSHLDGFGGRVLELTKESDEVLHETTEYFAVAYALDLAKTDDFVAIELGAGYGPWIARSGVLAKRKGIKKVTLVGVEADKEKFTWMRENLNNNGLVTDKKTTINLDLYNSAVSAGEKELFFPVLDNSSADYGAKASKLSEEKDYRGMALKTVRIPAIPLKEIMDKYQKIDIIYIDIQGAEESVIQSVVQYLNKKVKLIAIGTHNRQIEGNLLDIFFSNKWDLILESPCDFKYDLNKPSLTGMTINDGFQFWKNTSLN